MRTLKITFVFFILSSLTLFAQKKELTLKQSILSIRKELAPEKINALQWIPNSDSYCFIEDDILYRSSVSGKEKEEIISLEKLNNSIISEKKLKRFPNITWLNKEEFYFRNRNSYMKYNLVSNKSKSIDFDKKATNIDLNNTSFNIAYTIDNNLFIKRLNGGTDQISNESNKEIVYGQAVHRFEFGITKGIFWSEKGDKLAFYRMDETMVTDYPLVDMTSRVAKVNNIKYPMAGMKSHHVTLGVYDLKTKKTTYIKTEGAKEQYLTAVTWAPDGKSIFIGVLNRDQNHLKMNQYNAETGDFIKTLFEEKDAQYVEPEDSLIFVPGDNNQFLWLSNRDNYKQLYLYDTNGKLIKKVSNGNWDITSFIGFDKKNHIYFQAATNYGLERQIFKSDLKGKQTQLTKRKGTHTASVNQNGYIIDEFSNTNTPKEIKIFNSKSVVKKELLKANDPLKDYIYSRPELIRFKNNEGMTLNARMIKPSNFYKSKKYPVLVYVYGGSHAQMVRDNWLGGASMWMYYLAEKGYIIFTLDNRGSHNRSSDFEQATHRNLGDKELEDQLVGVEYLKSLSYVDTDRMAIHGWSYGGFMATSMMLRHPEVFKVGVAGGPVIDWSYYEIMYGERYMDTPQQNPEGYKKANVTNYVDNLKGNLLIIHGQIDNVVVPQHSMQLLKGSVDKGVQINFFTYPGHPHNVRGKDRVQLMQKVFDYIDEKLAD